MVVKPGFALDEKTKAGSADTGRELCVQPCFRRDERASPEWAFPKAFAKSVPRGVLRINPFEPLSIYEAVFSQPTLSNRRKLNGTFITWSLPAPAEETTGFIDKLYIGINFYLAPKAPGPFSSAESLASAQSQEKDQMAALIDSRAAI